MIPTLRKLCLPGVIDHDFGEIPEPELGKFMNSGQNIQEMMGLIRSRGMRAFVRNLYGNVRPLGVPDFGTRIRNIRK